MLEAAFGLAGEFDFRTTRIPDGTRPRNFSTAPILEHGNRGSADAGHSRVISGGQVAIRSATRCGDRSESSCSDKLPCQRPTAHRSTAQNRTRTQRSGTRNRTRRRWRRDTGSSRRHRRVMRVVKAFQRHSRFEYEYEYCRKRLSTSTTGCARTDERNVRMNGPGVAVRL